jgi:hypothetical protein
MVAKADVFREIAAEDRTAAHAFVEKQKMEAEEAAKAAELALAKKHAEEAEAARVAEDERQRRLRAAKQREEEWKKCLVEIEKNERLTYEEARFEGNLALTKFIQEAMAKLMEGRKHNTLEANPPVVEAVLRNIESPKQPAIPILV